MCLQWVKAGKQQHKITHINLQDTEERNGTEMKRVLNPVRALNYLLH
jgi:hypothetical protein